MLEGIAVTALGTMSGTSLDGVDAAALVAGLKSRGHRSARTIPDQAELAAMLASGITPGDIVVCLGAGDISRWAATLAPAIESQRGA